jgi:hypothetical protein
VSPQTKPRKFFLAIKHKPSGGYLPQMASYGFTRTEPSLDEPPRLFTKPGAARQALDRWLAGAWFEGAENSDGELSIQVVPQQGRRAADMEIVELELTARSLTEAQLRTL